MTKTTSNKSNGSMIAAIGTDGTRPVVWGLGETRHEAWSDAVQTEETWASAGRAYVEVPDHVAARVIEGLIDCGSLGIRVSVDHDGQIVAAEYVGADLSSDEEAEVES